MSWLEELPDGFWALTEPWREAGTTAIALTLGGLVGLVVLAGLGLVLWRQASERPRPVELVMRTVAALSVLAMLVVAVALPVWWTGQLGVPISVTVLTGAGLAVVAVSGFLAYTLVTRESTLVRVVGGLSGLLALGILGALVTWWTIGVGIAFQVALALWTFGGGFAGVLVMGGSVALIAVFTLLAYRLRDTQGWTSGLFGSMAVLVGLWWLIGIIPSAWIYFVDAEEELLKDQVIPGAITIGNLDVASNFYKVVRDSIVMVEGAIVLTAGVVLAFVIQRRFPRGLSEGEERGPTTGGYK